MTYASFLLDRNAVASRGDFLLELYPKLNGVETTIRISRRGTSTNPSPSPIVVSATDTILANKTYRRRLIQAPTLTQSLWAPGQVLSSSVPSFGSAKVTNQDGGLDPYMPSQGYVWGGCRYKCYFCDMLDVANTVGKIADGLMGDPQFTLTDIEIPLLGRETLFEVPLSTHVYRGTGFMLELFGDRTSSYGTPAAVNLTGSMTHEGWWWLDSLPTADVITTGWFGGTASPWQIVIRQTGVIRFRAHIAGVLETVTSSLLFAAQKFYHLTVIVSGRDVTFVLWDDETQTESIDVKVNAFSSATRSANLGGTFVHRSGSDATYRPWFDEHRVWNVARALSDIRANRHREISDGSIPATCVHYTRFNSGTGTTVTDSSATAANGTISGAGTSTWLHSQEGGPELAGTPKPVCWGEKFGGVPVLVDGVRQGYQAVGGGTINNVTSYEGGLSHTMLASSASFRTYLTTTPAAGQSLRYLPRGLFKLGSVPALPVSVSIEGYNGGALGYVNKGATITRDIVTRRGPKLVDPTDLDTASFTAYGIANTGTIGLYHQSPSPQVSIKTSLDSILRSGLGWWGYVRSSTLFHIERYSGPVVSAASANYRFDQRRITSVTPVAVSSVIYQVVVRYRENSVIHTEDQVAASVKGTANWRQWTTQWQEARSESDEALRAAYPGEASSVLVVDTLLQYAEDAQNLANYMYTTLKGKKSGWQVTVDSTGLQVSMGQSVTLTVALQAFREVQRIRLNLDGTKTFIVLTVVDTKQEGKVVLTVLGAA